MWKVELTEQDGSACAPIRLSEGPRVKTLVS